MKIAFQLVYPFYFKCLQSCLVIFTQFIAFFNVDSILLINVVDILIGAFPIRRKLLVFDCNGLLWSCKTARDPSTRSLSQEEHKAAGVHCIHSMIYFERLRLHQFLSDCFDKFDVAIWTCAGKRRTDAMVEAIFSEDERAKFKFIWDQSQIIDSGILRSDGNCNVMFKSLKRIWEHKEYVGLYDDSNTVLIDDSPLKSFLNPDFTSLHPSSFKFGDCKDTFLPDILWPLLEKLSLAQDVRRFLKLNMPKWSLKTCQLDQKSNHEQYALIKYRWREHVTKPSIPKYTIFDVSKYEVSRSEKKVMCNIPFPSQKSWTENNLIRIVKDVLGYEYKGPYLTDPSSFVHRIREIRKIDSKFDFKPVESIILCTRDFEVDPDGSKLTCSNLRCKDCLY